MKVYLLKDEDFEDLLKAIDLDASRSRNHGPTGPMTEERRRALDEAYRFYNYHIHTWIEKQKR